MKKRRGVVEEDVRREVGKAEEEEAEAIKEIVSESNQVVGSKNFGGG